ncbi:N-acetylglucosaminyl-phosphatidylinositol de-N-acetylase [Orbilia blumenaviensis]|uniref:N-acetylglucosaminylphosphatidylinositol deacetylase n=1 Tax=Orbilia blumenaviensis TaxID=1796055 RepID=A0AAV9UV47_9PEZI
MSTIQSPRGLGVFLLLPILMAAFCYYTLNQLSSHSPIRNRNIALLIAHPDDEAMFFSPTIQSLVDPSLKNTVQIVCFSIGNAEGIGNIRETELLASADLLGVPNATQSVLIYDEPGLPDSMTQAWPEDLVASVISESLKDLREENNGSKVDTFITFDKGGVSSHPNHISLLRGAKYYLRHYPVHHEILLYTLDTVPIYRKYLSIFDAFITTLLERKSDDTLQGEGEEGYSGNGAPKSAMYLSNWQAYRTAQRAMTEGHKSQMVWFRWGWITLSRYMVFNNLVLDTDRS